MLVSKESLGGIEYRTVTEGNCVQVQYDSGEVAWVLVVEAPESNRPEGYSGPITFRGMHQNGWIRSFRGDQILKKHPSVTIRTLILAAKA